MVDEKRVSAVCKQSGTAGYDTTFLLSGPRKGHKGETKEINIPRRANAAMSGLPAEIFLAFDVVVCIIAG